MRGIKFVFDRANIMNPGKLFHERACLGACRASGCFCLDGPIKCGPDRQGEPPVFRHLFVEAPPCQLTTT